jgi:hypothetical protein
MAVIKSATSIAAIVKVRIGFVTVVSPLPIRLVPQYRKFTLAQPVHKSQSKHLRLWVHWLYFWNTQVVDEGSSIPTVPHPRLQL